MAGDLQRYQIRHRIARLIEPEFFEGTATTYGTTSLADSGEMVNYADDALINAFVYLYSATTNADQERRITDSTSSGGTMAFAAISLPTGTVKYEVHRWLRIKDYNDAIDQAIRSVFDYGNANIAKAVDTSLTMTNDGTSTSYYYTVPTGFRYISKVYYESATASIYDFEVPRGAWADSIEKLTASSTTTDSVSQIKIDRRYWEPIADRQLRIIGGGVQDLLSADTSTISRHLENYIVRAASYDLVTNVKYGIGVDATQRAETAKQYASLAAEAKRMLKHLTPPGSIPVPF